MSKWLFDCKDNYPRKIDNNGSLTAAEKTQEKNKVANYAEMQNNPGILMVGPSVVAGVYSEGGMS